MSYLKIEIELNAATLKAEIYAAMEAAFTGWEANDANPEKVIIDAFVDRHVVPLSQLISDVPDQLLQKFGEQVARVPVIQPAAATVKSTWKFLTEEGLTIRAGTEVNIPTSADTAQGFRVVSDVVVAPGDDETAAGAVTLEAIDVGTQANGLTSGAELVDSLVYFDSITLVGESSGGVDEEDPITYLGRLTETMQIQAPRPIRARDVAILLRSIAGVQRVAVIDNYNDETKATEEEKTLSAYPIDVDGQVVSTKVREECEALLEEKREVNFIFFVGAPTYTAIDVHFEVVPRTGFDQTATDEAVEAAIEDALSPAVHGADPTSQDAVPTTWINQATLRYQDLVTLVNNVQAVEHYTVLKWAKSGGGLGTGDLVLSGAAPLPEPGAIAVGA